MASLRTQKKAFDKSRSRLRIRSALQLTASVLAMFGCALSLNAQVKFESQNLWNGGIGGYQTYRIPGLVISNKGTLIAYTSARRNLDSGDWSDIDVVMRRSTDGGKTWGASRRVAGNSMGTTDNPVAIVDKQRGTIHFLYQTNYSRCYYMRSDDDGVTFSTPTDITYVFDQFKPDYDWHVIAPGVGHAIQLKNGRLVIPTWMSIGTRELQHQGGRDHRPSAVATIYSDDHGKTWKRGAIIVNNSTEVPNPSETMAVQLATGTVMVNIRNESPKHRRLVSVSPDGSGQWSEPSFDDALYEPICAASIVRYSTESSGRRNILLFVNPDSENDPPNPGSKSGHRENLTLRASYDEGKTWNLSKVIDPGVAGYSDLAVQKDGTIFCIYEAGSIRRQETNNAHVTIAHFTLDWLTNAALGFGAGSQRQ